MTTTNLMDSSNSGVEEYVQSWYSEKPLVSTEQRAFMYFVSPFLTIFGYSLNLLVCAGLRRTGTIKQPTANLMFLQMSLNVVSITCQGIGAPVLLHLGLVEKSNSALSRFVASAAISCTYASLTLLIWTTVNRHVFIWYPLRAECVFSYRISIFACCTCLVIGAAFGASTLCDCCYGAFSIISLTFAFVGPKFETQYHSAWAYMGLVLSSSLAVYGLLLVKIRNTKKTLLHHNAAQRKALFGMETRLCVGFGLVALAWSVHLITLIVPTVPFKFRHPNLSIFYACSRWAMFVVDPTVYLLMTQDLRYSTGQCLRGFFNRTECRCRSGKKETRCYLKGKKPLSSTSQSDAF